MSGHNKAFIIRFYRKKFNITQEELAEQICSPVTIARYENGMIDPSDRHYQQIMDKLGRKDEAVIFNIQTRNLFFSAIRDNLLALFEKRQFSEAKLRIEELRKDKTLSDFYYENRQFIERIENNILLEQGEISINKFITKMEELLRLSYPEYHADSFITKAIYTETPYRRILLTAVSEKLSSLFHFFLQNPVSNPCQWKKKHSQKYCQSFPHNRRSDPLHLSETYLSLLLSVAKGLSL